jgi:hypothetical protein
MQSEIGQFNGNYEALALKNSTKPNKYGVAYYFQEKIYLQNTLKPVTDYTLWTSDEGKHYVVLPFDKDLKLELVKIMSMAKALQPELIFKEVVDNESHFIKLSPKLAQTLQPGFALSYVLQIYGIFVRSGGNAYLQMEIVEVNTKTFSMFVDLSVKN